MLDKTPNFRRSIDAAAANAGPREGFVTSGPGIEGSSWRVTGELHEGLEETLNRMIQDARSRPGWYDFVCLTATTLDVYFDAYNSRPGHYWLEAGGTTMELYREAGGWAAHLISELREPGGYDAKATLD